jgi:hypothetical protein
MRVLEVSSAETYATHDLIVAHALGQHGRLGLSAGVELAGLGWQNVRLTAGGILGGETRGRQQAREKHGPLFSL